MRIFFYEFITGGGLYSLPGSPVPSGSLLSEGLAMRNAFAADLLRDGHQVTMMRDERLSRPQFPGFAPDYAVKTIRSADEERTTLATLCRQSELSIVLAPEFDGLLLQRFDWCQASGGDVLGVRSFIDTASNKNSTATALATNGVPHTSGIPIKGRESLPSEFAFPAVLKPADGAGSIDTSAVHSLAEVEAKLEKDSREWRLENVHEGFPCSVAVLSGPSYLLPLPPVGQKVNSTNFTYSGGRLPIEHEYIARSQELATRAVRAIGGTCGYTGVDMIMGDEGDYVVDVNPRLTTSYVGLREICRDNLATALIDIGLGHSRELSWLDKQIDFDAFGNVASV